MRALPDERLFLGDDPAHPEVLRRAGAIRLLTADDVPLLGPKNMHGLGAVWRDTEGLAGRHHGFPERQAIPARRPELVGELAGERDPMQADRDRTGLRLANRHEWEAVRPHGEVREEAANHIPGSWTHDGDVGPLVGDRSQPNA